MADCLNNEEQINSNLSESNIDALTSNLDGASSVTSEMGVESSISSTMYSSDATTSNLASDDPIDSKLDLPTTYTYKGSETDNIVVTVDNKGFIISASVKQIKFNSVSDFPEVGSEHLIYIDATNKALYGWDANLGYYKLVADVKVPTKLSEFENDGDGRSPFATVDYVNQNAGGESYDDTEIRQSIADLETNVSKKLDRIDGSTSTALYGVGSSGQQVMFSVAQGTGTNTIVRRNGQQIKVPLTPSANDDATSKFYVDNLVSTIPKFSVEVVTSLPTENISTTTVYLVSSGSEEQNLYSEYIYVQDKENPELFKWEKLGEQRIDLSNYTTKEELAQAIAESLIDYYTSEQVDDLIENAKTKYKKVVSLPTSTEIEDNTIYLLQHTTDTGIYYTEHIYTNGSWEQFGSNADVDIVGILDNTKKIAISTGGFSAGSSSNVTGTGGAIGKSSQVSKGGAIGENATTSLGFAGGYNAKTIKTLADGISTSPSDAIQLGTGTNKKEKSLQVYDDNIYDAETHTLTVQNIELDGEDINDKIAQSSSSFMPIGSIFASAIPQEDARVHLLDGSVIQQDGVYADFVNLVKSLVSAGYNITCLESEYEEDIRKTGNCGRFIINSDSIRLPTITTFIQGLSDLTSLTDIGSKVEAGLPNIKASYSAFMRDDGINESVTGAFSVSKPRERSWNGASGDGVRALSFNANKYNSIYSDSVNTVQPPATRYPYYIVLASGYKSTQQVNVDNIMNEVNSKLSKSDLYLKYPVGSLYISTNSTSPADAVTNGGLGGGIWEQLPEGLALWTTQQEIAHEGSSNQNDITATVSRIINAGLPNITSKSTTYTQICGWTGSGNVAVGALVGRDSGYTPAGGGYGRFITLDLDASRSSDVYGNANTVQPPAYRVYAWKRVG